MSSMRDREKAALESKLRMAHQDLQDLMRDGWKFNWYSTVNGDAKMCCIAGALRIRHPDCADRIDENRLSWIALQAMNDGGIVDSNSPPPSLDAMLEVLDNRFDSMTELQVHM